MPEPEHFSGHTAEEWAGQLSLTVEQRDSVSVATHQFHQGSLRVLRPHYLDDTGQVNYALINPGGAYFGADRYRLGITVGNGASLLVTTQSATKVYKTPQGPAYQEMSVELDAGAVLEYVPDQLIVYREGAYRQKTRVEMSPSASFLACEIITPGWSPQGAGFGYDELRMRTEIAVCGEQGKRRLLVDQLRLQPATCPDIQMMGLLEGHTHLGQLVLADAGVDDALYEHLVAVLDESPTRSGISRIGGSKTYGVTGVLVRSLAHTTGQIQLLQHQLINTVRLHVRGQEGLDLRKY